MFNNIYLHELFNFFDINNNKSLTSKEIDSMLKTLDYQPIDTESLIQTTASTDSKSINDSDFITILIRAAFHSDYKDLNNKQKYTGLFEKYSSVLLSNEGLLDANNISKLMTECGLNPPDDLNKLVNESDIKGNGINHKGFMNLMFSSIGAISSMFSN